MTYSFTYALHGDIFLEEPLINFGYHVTHRLYLPAWLYGKQLGRNLLSTEFFQGERMPLEETEVERATNVKTFAKTLPLDQLAFNNGLDKLYLRDVFSGGSTRTRFTWTLQSDNKLHLLHEENSKLSMGANESAQFITDYLTFLQNEPHLSRIAAEARSFIEIVSH